ncbi:MAG: DNA adenine methylase [Spirochaetaceae bacterium]|jgi:adenine-specific DNA-methyltransferase|nr:DNA adenine methylase [Spirochaetaceae bacterium]
MLRAKNYFTRNEVIKENEEYLNKQIITYIGNKRALLPFINDGLNKVLMRLNKKKIKTFDVFSGSGIVARYLKPHSSKITVNDLEKYSEIINYCYLSNLSEINMQKLLEYYNKMLYQLDEEKLKPGFIAKLYAPGSRNLIRKGDRTFYTYRNACYIDTARKYIEKMPKKFKNYFLAPLLSEASIHSNTSGVFKGFYKDSKTGVGKFGGNNEDALERILGNIAIPFPVFSNFECEYEIHRGDSNAIIDSIDSVDLAYIDPPYNQHPYGSNYFMLNLIADYIEPRRISSISGIPDNWNRSFYNKKMYAHDAFKELVEKIKAKFLLISFNSEGFIKHGEMTNLLKKTGKLEILETRYNAFRGSRNLRSRKMYVKEYLYLVEKK